jgi:pyruvate dehydrogenase complex dehydrogenase (E1) component
MGFASWQRRDGALVDLMNKTPDGDYQTYKTEDGRLFVKTSLGVIHAHFKWSKT